MNDAGAPLREWMKANNFDVKTLAEHLGINPFTIYKFLNGERAASDGFRLKFADAYGMEMQRQIFGAEHVTA